MQLSYGMIFIFLLLSLQWDKSNTENSPGSEITTGNSSIRGGNNQPTVQTTSHRFLLGMTTTIKSSTVSQAAPTSAHAKKVVTNRRQMGNGLHSTTSKPTDGTTVSSNVTMVSKGGITNSVTNFTRIPMSLATFTTTGNFSGMTKTDAATSTATPSNSTVTSSTPSAAVLPSDNSSINPTTLFPTSITLTSPMVTKDSLTTNLKPIQQTTEQNQNSSNPSTTSSNSEDANEEKTNKVGIIVGVTVGAILGSIFIGLIGYLIWGKKRSESFSHRRLYDDTRNDPVLHLDSSLGPYDTNFGCVSHGNTSTADKAEEDNTGSSSYDIPMADIASSLPSL